MSHITNYKKLCIDNINHKNIDIKNTHITFSMILSIQKIWKNHTKVFLFTRLDM